MSTFILKFFFKIPVLVLSIFYKKKPSFRGHQFDIQSQALISLQPTLDLSTLPDNEIESIRNLIIKNRVQHNLSSSPKNFVNKVDHFLGKDKTLCREYIPSKISSNKAILFFHGGGYTMGSTADHMQLIASLVILSSISILGVDYRLCPQHRFPAPIDDAEAAYRWLMLQGYSQKAIGFSGISAGGLIVTQLIYRCQNQGIQIPSVALVMSGPKDLDFDRPSCIYNSKYDIIIPKRLRNIRNYYIPDHNDTKESELYPARQQYEKYPKTLFQVGDCEVLLDDSIEFFRFLRQQGHPINLQIIPDMIHCGQIFSDVYPPGEKAILSAAEFLQSSLSKDM